jgi:hypothetical protein
MSRKSKISLGLCAAAMAGLVSWTTLYAEDKKPDAKGDKPAAEAPMPKWAATAVKPKPLSDNVKKGLEYLAKAQLENGGWNQGGGWRTVEQGKGGRVEGGQVQDPADLGDTCIAVLAFIRAGNTPKDGPYAKNVAKGLDFICSKVEKSDDKSLMITDVKGTQMQSKIGPFVDTFLTSMVLAELKGRGQDEGADKRLVACLDKTVGKIEKNMQKDGGFAGNNGWASVLSQGLAMKGLNRAAQAGAMVNQEQLAKANEAAAKDFDGKAGKFTAGPSKGSDASVALYSQSAGNASLQEAVNTAQKRKEEAKKVLEDKQANKEQQDRARDDLKKIDEAEKVNDKAVAAIARQAQDQRFVAGFGNNGGEEFLSFMNISETLLVKGGEEWEKWDKNITAAAVKAQDKDGSWAGQHCITGKTFCTAAALLVLMSDRAPIPVAAKQPEKK